MMVMIFSYQISIIYLMVAAAVDWYPWVVDDHSHYT